jgi:hypothetical protein
METTSVSIGDTSETKQLPHPIAANHPTQLFGRGLWGAVLFPALITSIVLPAIGGKEVRQSPFCFPLVGA